MTLDCFLCSNKVYCNLIAFLLLWRLYRELISNYAEGHGLSCCDQKINEYSITCQPFSSDKWLEMSNIHETALELVLELYLWMKDGKELLDNLIQSAYKMQWSPTV